MLYVHREPLLHLKPRDNQKPICITECRLQFTKIIIIQHCVCALACLSLHACECVFTCTLSRDSPCVVSPDKSPRSTLLFHSLFLCHMHTCTGKCVQTHMARVDLLIFSALLFLIHLLNLPPPTHMHAPTHTTGKHSQRLKLCSHESSSGEEKFKERLNESERK